MVIYIALLLIAVVFTILAFTLSEVEHDDLKFICSLIATILAASLIIVTIIVVMNHATIDASFAGYHQRYNILLHQAKNGMYNNDNEYGKRDLVKEIERWNCDLARRRELSKNPLTNIFYPGDYYEFDFIPLELIK